MTLVPDWDFLDIEFELDRLNWSDHDRESDLTNCLLGPTDVLTVESTGYCKTQTDPTEDSINVGRYPVGSRF